MNVTDFRRSSPLLVLGTSTSSLAIGGVTVSSNASASDGAVLVATGSNSAIWRDALSFGSNATDVSSAASGGASSSNSRADHVHRGVRSISHTSNTSFGNVTLVAQDPVHITGTGNGTYTVGAVAVRSLSHSSNTFTGALTLTTPGNSVGITSPGPGALAFTAAATGSGGGSSDLSGVELTYAEKTTDTSITATTEATANTIVTGAAIVGDGSLKVMIDFFCDEVTLAASATNNFVVFYLYDDTGGGAASVGAIGVLLAANSTSHRAPMRLGRRLLPTAANHTYSVRAIVGSGTATVGAGAGGLGTRAPAYIRITRV